MDENELDGRLGRLRNLDGDRQRLLRERRSVERDEKRTVNHMANTTTVIMKRKLPG